MDSPQGALAARRPDSSSGSSWSCSPIGSYDTITRISAPAASCTRSSAGGEPASPTPTDQDSLVGEALVHTDNEEDEVTPNASAQDFQQLIMTNGNGVNLQNARTKTYFNDVNITENDDTQLPRSGIVSDGSSGYIGVNRVRGNDIQGVSSTNGGGVDVSEGLYFCYNSVV